MCVVHLHPPSTECDAWHIVGIQETWVNSLVVKA